MLAPVSVGLKFGFLIVLYLFLMWVAWSAMRDLRRGRGGAVRPEEPAGYDATGMYSAASGLGDLARRRLRAAADGRASAWARERQCV